MEPLPQEFDATISLRKIKQHPQNPRRGDDEAVGESIDVNGFFGAVLVQRSTGHILAGNTRWRAMRKRKAKSLPGFWIDCDDETALRILLADNRTSDLAVYDDATLRDLLVQLEQQAGLIGTGYTDADLAALLIAQEADLGDDSSFRDSEDEVTGEPDGALLALADVTLSPPIATVTAGDVFELSGRHILVHCELMTGSQHWLPWLLDRQSPHTVFLPYPGPYVADAQYVTERTFIMVQPNQFLAASLIDKWRSVHGEASAVKL